MDPEHPEAARRGPDPAAGRVARRSDESGSTVEPTTGSAGRALDRWDWLIAIALAVVIIGPGLRPGPLLNLDLLVTPEVPVPNGIWGLGPQLSQRTPLFVIFGLGSVIVGGPVTVKAFFVAAIVAGYLGMVRLLGTSAQRWGRSAAGVLWVGGPFLVTRLAVGHVQFLWLAAVLPWVVGPLLRPSRRLGSTFLATAALAFGGPTPGVFAVLLVAVGLLTEPDSSVSVDSATSAASRVSTDSAASAGSVASAEVVDSAGTGGALSARLAGLWRRSTATVPVVAAASLLWVGPTVVLLWAGAQVTGAGGFVVHADGADGWLSLLVGGGFWNSPTQVGGAGWGAAFVGVILAGFAVFGVRRMPWWGRPLTVVGVLGLVLTVSSAVPGISGLYESLTALPIGAPLRESQRFALLWLLWLAPASAVGAEAAASALRRTDRSRSFAGVSEVLRLVPLAGVLAISVGGWWGMGGVIAPVTFPDGWAEARAVLRAEPATTVALPWNEYYGWSFTDGRHSFNPLPDYLGGDVISSYDPQFDDRGGSQEQVDRRAWFLDARLRGEGDLGPAFEAVGARYVVVVEQQGACLGLPEPQGACRDRLRLDAEPDHFELLFDDGDVSVFEVRSWRGDAVAPDGAAHDLRRPVPPVITTDAPPGSVLGVSGAPGWVQGWFRAVPLTDEGLLRLPEGGSGPVWFWPAVPLMAIDCSILGAAMVLIGRRWRSERS